MKSTANPLGTAMPAVSGRPVPGPRSGAGPRRLLCGPAPDPRRGRGGRIAGKQGLGRRSGDAVAQARLGQGGHALPLGEDHRLEPAWQAADPLPCAHRPRPWTTIGHGLVRATPWAERRRHHFRHQKIDVSDAYCHTIYMQKIDTNRDPMRGETPWPRPGEWYSASMSAA
jgi:hypothetical protein